MNKENWEVKKINEICTSASSNLALNKLTENVGKYALFGASGYMKNIDFYHQSKKYIAVIKDGAGAGRVMILPAFSSILGTLQYILPNEGVDIKFLFYLLNGVNLSGFSTGATIPHIYFKDYGQLEIPIPPLPIQEAIVKELDTLHRLKELQEQQLDEYDNLAQSTFYSMFGDPVENERGWEVKKLGEVCEVVRGGSPRPISKYLGGNIPWIKIGDATIEDSIYLHSTKEHIISEGISKSRLIPAGSMIFANCGVSLGFARIITFEGCIHDGWLALNIIDENVYSKLFLLKLLNMQTSYFRQIAPDGTQPNLNTSIMKNLDIIHPEFNKQISYVENIKKIEEQKELVKQSISQTQLLIDYTMDKYFG